MMQAGMSTLLQQSATARLSKEALLYGRNECSHIRRAGAILQLKRRSAKILCPGLTLPRVDFEGGPLR